MALLARLTPSDELIWQSERIGLSPVPEYRFAYPRRWRFDVSFPEKKVAAEVDGGLYMQGRHSRGAGREKDMEKLNEALILGWRVLVVSPKHVQNGQALKWIERLMKEPQ